MPNKTYVIDGVEYALVPVEPTPEMLAATSWPGCAATDYEHMLAAAPAPAPVATVAMPTPEQVADELGMGSGAWDMVEPEKLIAAVLKVARIAPTPVATEAVAQGGGVDCIGLALDLEKQAKTVESQTTERAMIAAAHGLRLLASAPAGTVWDGFVSAGVVINNNQPGSQYIVEAPYGQTVCVGTEVFIK